MTVHSTCAACGAPITKEIPGLINVRGEPERKELVMSGELFIASCPACGKRQLVSAPFLYHDPDERLMLWLSADDASRERAALLFASTPELEDYTCRLVNSVGDLLEKIKIFDAGLSDIAVELCKLVTSEEAGEELPLKFMRIDDSSAEIHFACPKNGQMEVMAVGLNVYEDCRGILARNPQMTENAKGPVCIDQAWLSQYFA
ncbi:MAG: CpXC domain-containing protein [Bacteroidales bacterium]|nr:CpXC domain-containing protein [Bacteroidales bacterium]